jgi:hypothetical protein
VNPAVKLPAAAAENDVRQAGLYLGDGLRCAPNGRQNGDG